METYKKIYIFAASLVGVIILILVLSFLRLHFNPAPSQYLSLGYFNDNLKDVYKVIVTVDDKPYKVKSPEDLKSILQFEQWEETDEQPVNDDALFVMDIRGRQQYTFYPDGYVHAYTSVTESQKYFKIADETQYRIPAELAQEILDYVLSGGGILVIDAEPTGEELCLENLMPFLGITWVDPIRVLSWEKSTWGEYRDRFQSAEILGHEDDDPVLIADLEYPGEEGQTLAAIVVFSAKSCTPIEMQPKNGAEQSDPETSTPNGGVDPNAEQEPTERAAAFLANAEMTSYEAAAILYKDTYIVPVVEYVPTSQYMEHGFDHTQWILDLLHGFDLTTMEQVHVPGQQEGIWHNTTVIGVGDATCRMTFWYEKMPAEEPSVHTIVVFTFSDASACAFDGGAQNEKCSDLLMADQLTRSGYPYTLMGNGGNMTVTQVQTGKSRVASPHMSAVGRAILKAAAQHGEETPGTEGNYDRRVEFADGAVWMLDLEGLLAKSEDGRVCSLEGFENYDKTAFAAVFQLPDN